MNKDVLVTGENGQLGSEIKSLSANYPQYNFSFVDRSSLDLSNLCKLEEYFDDKSFSFIINCAAYTAVDKAESEADLANTVNNKGLSLLAKIAKNKGISFIHISTDYVFDGTNHMPYVETDKTNPQSVYGQTKYEGENSILELNLKNSLIIRTSWVYSTFGNNFVKTMLRLGNEKDELGVIFDQVGTPTYAKDLAKTILDILPQIKNTTTQLYHFSNEGVCSWYDFAKAIFELSDISCKVNPIETKDYPTAAKRPHYSLLNKSKIKQDFAIEIPYWKDSLKDCLTTLKEKNVNS